MERKRLLLALLEILIFGLAISACPGCAMMPQTSSTLKVGSSSLESPKKSEFDEMEYVERQADGSYYRLLVKGSKTDPSAALDAYVKAQAKQTELLQSLVNKIPAPTAADLLGIPPLLRK